MGQEHNNSRRDKVAHCVRHMGKYIQEVTSGSVTPEREIELKEHFAEAKELAKQTYVTAFKLNCMLDGEQCDDTAAKVAWDNAIRSSNTSEYGDYSGDALHTFQHFDDYIEEVERGDVSDERKTELKERFSTLMKQAVRLYFDEGRLILILDA